ncbi:MAG: DNA repair protein RecN [Gammaproteobacteria bacterium]|nr:DNA repair protein RecN [Gammaproteobacteria bacterium]|tara:strand:+ start:3497 stop:5170 length:1674 start_codon:yes stop_codon:yes gene_type:complete
MLRLIKVKNYTVIDEVEVNLQSGLSVMTGETGAGKSILVDALGLALGNRADASTVRPGTERAEISVIFEFSIDHPAMSWLIEHGLDNEETCLLRRVIYAEGRSRAFINSTPVTRQDLRTLGTLLVNIHGQTAHQALLHGTAQREILDDHGNTSLLAKEVAKNFSSWQTLNEELDIQNKNKGDQQLKFELLNFQIEELETLNLKEGEVESLEIERNRLAHVDKISSSLNKILEDTYERDEASAHHLVSTAHRSLDGLLELDASLSEPLDQLNQIEIQLRETAVELLRYRDDLEPDPHRLEWIETRLSKARELATRNKIESKNLFNLLDHLKNKIEKLKNTSDSLNTLLKSVAEAKDLYMQTAKQLTKMRTNNASSLSEAVTSQIIELGLPHGRFRAIVKDKTIEQADATGLDWIEFQVVLNPGQNFGPLSKVASGGELSRISLALEVVSAGFLGVSTLVFDEVDAGIGGGVAEIVGRRLSDIASKRQVLCVTHLPQVASQGLHHFRIHKLTDGKTTRTNVRILQSKERIEELSRMLGGVEITDTTRAHAQEMVQRGNH